MAGDRRNSTFPSDTLTPAVLILLLTMQNPLTRLVLLLGILLLILFPFAGLAPLLVLVLIGLAGMIFQLVGEVLGKPTSQDS